MERRDFLGSVFGLTGFITNGFQPDSYLPHEVLIQKGEKRKIQLKGSLNNEVTHWDIITIGNLSRNRYWGESDERPLRSAICTCTVISGKDFHLIVDPSLEDEKAMAAELDRRTGLTTDQIDTVFVTHQHGDHLYGIRHFMNARWLAGTEVVKALNGSSQYQAKFEPAGEKIYGIIDVVPTPGHTPDHHSLRFDYNGFSVFIAGDSVATKDYWGERRMYYNVFDPAQSQLTLEKISLVSDIIVPGHDNYFLNI